ncbi:hypothetical protein WMY93_033871 [Mugilogobius chulae]|uniref:Uncharacterized protein n=1 Tax=Mugilogobius chulae TaxID=88201 RepID=A0AAW0MLF3_9GOBI
MSNRGDKRPLKPKTLVLADNANSAATGGNPFADNDHDYLACSVPLPETEELMNEFPALPLSPTQSPAPKKAMHSKAENVDVVATLSKLINKRMDDLALQLVGVKKTVDFVCEEIKDVKGRVKTLEVRVTKEVDRLDTNQQRIADLERYSRRWNLRLLGVKETEKEDARKIAIEICQAVLPEQKKRIRDTIDTVHRVGAKLPNANKSRTIIIQFISRVTRDGLWKPTKTSPFLKENHLKFAEDLSKEDRERRSKLWPLIEKARNEGKKAYYVGCRGFINRTEIPLPSE